MEQKLKRIAEIQRALKPIEEQVKPMKDELDRLKFEVMQEMRDVKSKRTENVSGIYAIRVEKKTLKVENDELVFDWMLENDIDTTGYMKMTLDTKKIGDLAKKTLNDTGEVVPGIVESVTEYITLKEES